jgi:hypothetical protein
MTDELAAYGDGAYISKFVSAGPKNYGYEVTVPDKDEKIYKMKIKGFSLNYQTAQSLTIDTQVAFVKEYVKGNEETIEIKQDRIGRLEDRSVVTLPQTKKYRVVYGKRVVSQDFTTKPYGF